MIGALLWGIGASLALAKALFSQILQEMTA